MTGTGTQADPYIIETAADLNQITNDNDAWYELGSDIDATGLTYVEGDFRGRFDGKGFTISNLDFGADAFFDTVTGFNAPSSIARISNVTFNNCQTTKTALVSRIIQETVEFDAIELLSCTINSSTFLTGGFISNVNSNGDFTMRDCALVSSSVSGTNDNAGVIARQEGTALIENCRIESTTVTSSQTVASGLISITNATTTINNVVSSADVVASDAWGLTKDNNATITNSFWDTTVGPASTGGGGTGKTTAELKDIDTYTNTATAGLTTAWDMVLLASHDGQEATATWAIDDGVDYPVLWYEVEAGGSTFEASFSINSAMQAASSSQSVAEAGITINSQQGITDGSTATGESLLTIAHSQDASTQSTSQAEASLSLSNLLQIAFSKQSVTDASFSLPVVHQVTTVSDTQIINEASFSLALQKAITTEQISTIEVSYSLNSAQQTAMQSVSTAEAAMSINLTAAINFISTALAEAGISFNAVQSLTFSGQTVGVVVTLAEGRTLTISLQNRTYTIPSESRTFTILADNRTLTIEP